MKTVNKEGKYLQSKTFWRDCEESDSEFEDETDQTLNKFLRMIDSGDLYQIIPIGKGEYTAEILVLYFTYPDLCPICNKFIDECECKEGKRK